MSYSYRSSALFPIIVGTVTGTAFSYSLSLFVGKQPDQSQAVEAALGALHDHPNKLLHQGKWLFMSDYLGDVYIYSTKDERWKSIEPVSYHHDPLQPYGAATCSTDMECQELSEEPSTHVEW